MSGFFSAKVPAGLVERAAGGSHEAQAVLYETYAGAVYTLARRLVGRSAVAEEILQDTFVEVLDKLGTLRSPPAVGGWIRTITVNKALMYLRGSHRLEPLDFTIATPAPDPAGLDLEQLLDRLSPLGRAVVWLHDVEGYTHHEIGRLMGRTASFSKSQLSRAYRRLRAAVAQQDREEGLTCMPVSNS